MISLIAVGISEYRRKNYNCIPCAINDAEKIYNVFRDVLTSDFLDYNSICLFDVENDQFLKVLEAVKCNVGSNDILILYFSCHAAFVHEDLCLLFDEKELPMENVLGEVKKVNAKVLIILDCCDAGSATRLARTINAENQISILASCGVHEKAKYISEGSEFTKIFCKACRNIDNRYGEISLKELSKEIKELGYKDLLINPGVSQEGDLIIKSSSNSGREYTNFPKLFLKALKKANTITQEAMWYSIVEISTNLVETICKEYFSVFNDSTEFLPEASWLVRRAIGSSLSHFNELEYISKELLTSLHWQEQCIGMIALRYGIREDKNTFNFLTVQIRNKRITRIDAIWLANLYMSENEVYDYKLFFGTDLVETTWGQIELYKTMINFGETEEKAQNEFRNEMGEKALEGINQFIAFRDCTEAENILFTLIQKEKPRPRLPIRAKEKFLLSALYGSWRGQLNFGLKTYFETVEKTKIGEELSEASSLPCIEQKMGIYDYLANNPEQLSMYEGYMRWGLSDSHPWVRRSAIRAFKSINYDKEKIFESIITVDYGNLTLPGLLDVLLECPIDLAEELKKHVKEDNDWACVVAKIH